MSMDSLFNNDGEIQLIEQALKNEQILEALGPLNSNWFDEINDEFVQEMFNESFQEKIQFSNGVKDEKSEQPVVKAVHPTNTDATVSCTDENGVEGCISQAEESFLNQEESNLHSCSGIEGDMLKIADKFEQEFYFNSKAFESSTSPQCQSMSSKGANATTLSSSRIEKPSTHFLNSTNKAQMESFRATEQTSKLKKFDALAVTSNFSESCSAVGFTTASSKPLQCSSEALKKAKLHFENVDGDKESITSTADFVHSSVPQLSGFKTASNKPLSISNNALEKANAIFNSLKEEGTSNKQCNFDQSKVSTSHKAAKNDQSCSVLSTVSHQKFTVGFKTASNKLMTISTAAWKKGQSFMQAAEEAAVHHLTPSKEDVASNRLPSLSNTNKQTFYANTGLLNANSIDNGCKNKRLSLPACSAINSPLFKPTNAKRRNSFYKPPRKRPPLAEVETNIPSSRLKTAATEILPAVKKQLGVRHDQENQIFVSDESLLKAMAIFEQV